MNHRSLLFPLTLFMAILSTASSAEEPVSFRRDLAPILLDRCVSCHGSKKAEGGYRADSYDRVRREGDSGSEGFAAGDIDSSEAFRRIVSEDADERMPLESAPLPAEQIELFRRWIAEGANYDGEDPQADLITIVPPPTYPAAPDAYRFPLAVTAVALNQDATQLVASGYHELTVWDLSSGSLLRRIGNIGQRTRAIRYSPDYEHLAVACGAPGKRGEVRIVNAASGELEKVLAPTSDEMFDVAFNPAGDHLATAAADGTISIFEFPTGKLVREIRSHSDWVLAVAWSADGTKLASASRDKTAKVFDISSGELLITYSGHKATVRGVAFHPNGTEVYSSGADNKVHRWKVADGKSAAQLGFGGEVFRLSTTGDGLLATSADKTVRRFEVAENKEVKSYGGHQDWAISADYHQVAKRVVAGGMDGMIRVWDSESGDELLSLLAAPGLQP